MLKNLTRQERRTSEAKRSRKRSNYSNSKDFQSRFCLDWFIGRSFQKEKESEAPLKCSAFFYKYFDRQRLFCIDVYVKVLRHIFFKTESLYSRESRKKRTMQLQ